MSRSVIPFLAVLLLMSLSCTKPGESSWRSEVVFETDAMIGGCAFGDLEATRPGNEIAAVCRSGEIHVISLDGDGWKSELLFTSPGEMNQCAIGDVDPDLPGLELAACGYSGRLVVIKCCSDK
jgi:hypothetical protein